jgi:hypothetical protein
MFGAGVVEEERTTVARSRCSRAGAGHPTIADTKRITQLRAVRWRLTPFKRAARMPVKA